MLAGPEEDKNTWRATSQHSRLEWSLPSGILFRIQVDWHLLCSCNFLKSSAFFYFYFFKRRRKSYNSWINFLAAHLMVSSFLVLCKRFWRLCWCCSTSVINPYFYLCQKLIYQQGRDALQWKLHQLSSILQIFLIWSAGRYTSSKELLDCLPIARCRDHFV